MKRKIERQTSSPGQVSCFIFPMMPIVTPYLKARLYLGWGVTQSEKKTINCHKVNVAVKTISQPNDPMRPKIHCGSQLSL